MARVTWLPEVLRAAGLVCHIYDDKWRTRGYDGFNPVAVVAHATAGSLTSTDAGEMRVLWVTGSVSAPVPISQLYLSRSGEWWVGATGTCNHIGNSVLPGTGQAGNDNAIGIEAQHNPSEPWSAKQYDSYVKGVAAICKHMGWPVSRVFGHYEISSSGKTDPYFNMPKFRERVNAAMEGDDVSAKDVWQTDGIVGAPRVDGMGRPVDISSNPHWWAGNLIRNHFELTATARGEQLAQHEALMAALEAVKSNPNLDMEQVKAAAAAGAEEALANADISVTWGPKGE